MSPWLILIKQKKHPEHYKKVSIRVITVLYEESQGLVPAAYIYSDVIITTTHIWNCDKYGLVNEG